MCSRAFCYTDQMKEVYLLRHAQRGVSSPLSEIGKHQARQLGSKLPGFAIVIASNSPRTIATAELLSDRKPVTDNRADYYATTEEVSAEIAKLAAEKSINFFEAADIYNDGALVEGVQAQAASLNELVGDTLAELDDGERALVVSHDMTIVPAMVLRDQPRRSVNNLSGYVIDANWAIAAFDARQLN